MSNGRPLSLGRLLPLRARPEGEPRGRPLAERGRDAVRWLREPGNALYALAFLAILVAGLWLRVRNNDYGLPYVYNFDEATHFTNRAVGMFGGSLDPGYYQNPSAFTYIVYVILRVKYGALSPIFDLPAGTVSEQFRYDPTPIWETARDLSAIIGMLGVVAVWWVGDRLFGRREAIVAAALLAFTFLPVTYSRIAVTDVGTFLPVALAVYGAVRAYEGGRLRHYLLAGAATGLAIGFKYTAGLVLLPLVLACGLRAWRDPRPLIRRVDLRHGLLSLVTMVAVVFVTNPFLFIKPVAAAYQLKQQAEAAGDQAKLGQDQEGGYEYYLDTLTWGFGWVAAFAALAGAIVLVRRDRIRGALVLLFPLALFLYMGAQTRYFGRWLLPMYPVLALLCGVALARVADLFRERRTLAAAALVVGVVALLAQPIASSVRTSNLLGKEDTRQTARDFLVDNYRKHLRIVIEPGVPENYYRAAPEDACTRAERAQGETRCDPAGARQFVSGFVRDIRRQANLDAPEGTSITYAATLNPDVIDEYRAKGFCLVLTMSVIRGRAENAKVGPALAYYDRLERESRRVFHDTPFKPGRDPVPLHFDFSYNYYPTAYERPGPVVDVYRLNNCQQQFRKVPNRPVGTKGLEKGMGTSFFGR